MPPLGAWPEHLLPKGLTPMKQIGYAALTMNEARTNSPVEEMQDRTLAVSGVDPCLSSSSNYYWFTNPPAALAGCFG